MKRTILYICGIASLLGAVSCQDFLTRDPKLSQSTEITLSTYDGLNDATFGAYSALASTSWYGQTWIVDAEMRSGNGKKSDFKNSGRCIAPYIWNYTETSTSPMWAVCYQVVSRANNVIDNLEGKESSTVTTQDLNNLKAECLFIRAFSYFCNVLTYGQPYTYCVKSDKESLGVPYVEHTDPAGLPARETVISNYEKIVRDLLEAESLIDPEYTRATVADPAAVVSVYAIQALLSRVYLYMGEWQKAADYATKVIVSGKFSLWNAEQYKTVWGAEKGSGEVIFEVYGKRTNAGWGSWEDLTYLTSPEGSGDAQAADPLIKTYEEGDVRLALYRTDADNKSGIKWTGKYPGKGDNTPDCNNIIVLRLSEMYLNRAEAIMRGATVPGTTAVNDINAVATLRGASAYGSVGQTDIAKERRRELAWEGHYIYDLARWGQGVSRSASDYPLCSANLEVPFPDKKWALPLPKRELDLNKNLVQNPL